jgi:hypothetical protein
MQVLMGKNSTINMLQLCYNVNVYNNTNPIGYFIVLNMLANNVHVRMIAINKKPITGHCKELIMVEGGN